MIPHPKEIDLCTGAMPLTAATRIAAGDPALLPLARQLAHELAVFAKMRPAVVEGRGGPRDIALAMDAALPAEGYVLDVKDAA